VQAVCASPVLAGGTKGAVHKRPVVTGAGQRRQGLVTTGRRLLRYPSGTAVLVSIGRSGPTKSPRALWTSTPHTVRNARYFYKRFTDAVQEANAFATELAVLRAVKGVPGFAQLVGTRMTGGVPTLVTRVAGQRGGESLRGLSSTEAVELVVQLLDRLEYLHTTVGYLHRDVKPANFRVDHGEVILIDFGSALPLEGGRARADLAVGTAGFAAYEQLAPGPLGASADVFGAAKTLLALTRSDQNEVVSKNHFELTEPLDPGLRDIVRRALRASPASRYQSAREFAEALRGWQAGRRDAAPARRKIFGLFPLP
jgi:serine/threonine protein kinase